MTQLTIEQAFQLAVQHHQAGQLPQAETLYRQILSQQPRHVGALHYLGVIAHQVRRNDSAIDLIRQAIALQPDNADLHIDLGTALEDIGQKDQAIAAYRRAIVIKPDSAIAHNNLGNVLEQIGQTEQAIAACRQAIALDPNYADPHNNLGNALSDAGQLDQAIAAYRQAILLKSNFPQAHNNLGNVLRRAGQLDQAVAAYQQAISLNPNLAETHNNLATALADNRQLDLAIAAYRRAIALKPNAANFYINLGGALSEMGQQEQAVANIRQAIALDPNDATAYSNLGNALRDMARIDEAIPAYRHAIALAPNSSKAHSALIYAMHFHPGSDEQAIADEYRRWNRQHAEPLKSFIQPHPNDRNPQRRLRIGYVSPDFRNHPVGRFVLPLLANHDKIQVEVFAYSQTLITDATTQLLRSHIDCWRNIVGLSDAQAAELIRRDQIDILVDLTMHTAGNDLLIFARKPAPVQVTWLGYPGSTGLTAIDYRLTDPYLDPPGIDESVYSEQTIRLPHTFWCYDPVDCRDLPINSLPALQNRFVTFGCLNKFGKINPANLSLWAAVLRQVKESRLLVLANPSSHVQQAAEQLSREGIDPARFESIPRRSHRQYMELFHRIDLALDTLPYNGHTTSLDGLWMGIPVVSLSGKTAAGRAGVSILSNLGRPELVAHSEEEYVRIATDLPHDLPRLSNLRSSLRQQMEQSPLMDAPRFARNFESAYRQMWQTWIKSELNS